MLNHRQIAWLKRGVMGLRMALIELAALGATYQVIATVHDKQAFPPPGQLVNVGGYNL